MKKNIKWLAILIAGFTLSTNAATLTWNGYNWLMDGAGDPIVINAASVESNGYFAGGNVMIASGSGIGTNNHLIIDAADVLSGTGSSMFSIGSNIGRNNNTVELTNGATVSVAGYLILGSSGSTGNRLILGEDSTFKTSTYFLSYNGNIVEFAGGTVRVGTDLRLYTNSEIVVSGDYAAGETLLSWNSIDSGASYLNTAEKILAAFNAGGSGYEFGLGADGKSIQVIPEPAAALMLAGVAGLVGFYRRFFCKL